jgi:hypothetical protein
VGAGDVKPLWLAHAFCRRQQSQRQRGDGDAERDVDEEHPVPIEQVREDAAEQHAERSPAGSDESEEPHRLRALRLLDEERDD